MDHREVAASVSPYKETAINHVSPAKRWHAVDSVKRERRSQSHNGAVTVYCSLEIRWANQSSHIWINGKRRLDRTGRKSWLIPCQTVCCAELKGNIPKHIFHPHALYLDDSQGVRITKATKGYLKSTLQHLQGSLMSSAVAGFHLVQLCDVAMLFCPQRRSFSDLVISSQVGFLRSGVCTGCWPDSLCCSGVGVWLVTSYSLWRGQSLWESQIIVLNGRD